MPSLIPLHWALQGLKWGKEEGERGRGGALSTPRSAAELPAAVLQKCMCLCRDDHRPYLPPSSFPDSNRFPLDSSTGYFPSASIRVVYLDITSGRS